MWPGKANPDNKKEIETEFPTGTKVSILGTDDTGTIVGNLRILYPEDENKKFDYDNGSWFIDVKINEDTKPLDPWVLSVI